ncbi:hypothetical protein [Acidithiobacillus ferridurans]|uniref:Adenylosuccinate synthase n=1 Tax=Acidithiobacillus ferridurans TaxID=1232575 RepID=A0A8X8GC27_ACIFI|nr:hypothetical protein [Acidithiobacillus ferridurans]MBU2714599.1 adenylosuccinate synthase [Acidithiobacillus ferridurans]MBU2723882.1 adenylosuccinate synthase [Acidithiobacillus ferridurans]MBU2726322.1 adenylosuccinate synthase [Acidithiobacillus ferridurans]
MMHKDLCALARTWLQRPASRSGPGCAVAVSESGNWVNKEVVDAIGWRPYGERAGSVLVEAKTSRSDFFADRAKKHRANSERGVGKYRYFMAPEGLLRMDEIPPQWGFITVNRRGHIKVVAGHVHLRRGEPDSWAHPCHAPAETALLIQCLARVGDPQRVQDMIREASNRNTKLLRENKKMREEIRRMESVLATRPC